MRQKTFISDTEFKIGDLVFLVEKVNTNQNYSTWYAYEWDGEGMEGNMNPNIKRYHGWRGTTNDNAYYAHSVRKVIKVTPLYEDFDFPEYWKITVGKDLYPERD